MNKDMMIRRIFYLFSACGAGIIFAFATGCRQEQTPITKEKITIAYTVNTSALLSHIAFAKSYYAQEGLEAIPQPYSFDKLALQAVLDGKADIATLADTPFMLAIMNGQDIAVIASIQSTSKNEAVFALKSRGIVKLSDLKGKKIGVTPGTAGDFFLDAFLLYNNLSRKEIKVVELTPEKMPVALRSGLVDAVVTWNPTLWHLQKEWGTKATVFFEENIYKELFCLVTTKNYAQNNPQAIKKLLRALLKAEDFAYEQPEEAQSAVTDFIKLDKAIISDLWGIFNLRVNLTQELIVSLEDQTRWALKYKLTKQRRMPNYIDYIYFDGLKAIKPDRVKIIH